jgi:hypothetical protein
MRLLLHLHKRTSVQLTATFIGLRVVGWAADHIPKPLISRGS